MPGMPTSPVPSSVKFWMERTGHRPADPPAAYFTPDGEERKVPSNPRAEAAAQEIDVADLTRLRAEQAVRMANSMRHAFGPFETLGDDHPFLQPHERAVPPLPYGIGDELAVAIFG